MKKNRYARLNIKGYNLNNFLNTCINCNIELLDIEKINPKEMNVTLKDKDLKLFNRLDLSNYQIEILAPSVKNKFLHLLLYRIGLIVGCIVGVLLFCFMQNRLLDIKIYGIERIDKQTIVEKINEYGLNKYSIMDFDSDDLEKYLMDNFDLSFVSIKSKGNCLIINAKEELADISEEYLPIIAEYNMIVKDVMVYSGTIKVKNGDIVFAGDTLVEPYEIVNGEKINIVPCADIEGEVYFCSSYNFVENENICVTTGKSQVIGVEYYLGKYKLSDNTYDCKFASYDIEVVDNLISNYFLPIHIKKIVAYEKVNEEVVRNFEEEKDEIIEKIKQEAYGQVPNNLKIESEDIKINSTNYGNIVTIYLKSSVYLKYNN